MANLIENTIKVLDLPIHFLDRPGKNDVPALLLLHGFASGAYTWKALMRNLQIPNRIVAPDLPGNGDSPLPREKPTLEYHARFAEEFCRKAGLECLYAVGHSMGGAILAYLSLRTSSLRRMILENPADDRAQTSTLFKMLAIPVIGETALRFYPPSRSIFRSRLEKGIYSSEALTPEFFEDSWNAFTRGFTRRWIPMALRVSKTPVAWDQITIPCTIIHGADDPLTPPSFIERIRTLSPTAIFKCFEKCKHVPHLEYPAKFQSLLEDWIRQ